MIKIERVEDLPEWFDLSKYAELESFKAAEWLRELSFRQQLLVSNPTYPTDNALSPTPENWSFWRKAVHERAKYLRSSPVKRQDITSVCIVHGKKAPILTSYRGGLMSVPVSEAYSPVRHLTMHDLLFQALSDCSDAASVSDAKKRWDILDNRFGGSFSVDGKLAEKPVNIGGASVLSIDLDASDAVIKQAFERWLKLARTESPLHKQPKRPAYERWHRYGLLPYLDLLIWEMETDSRIPDRVMSAAISSYDQGEDNLRKTIAPLARQLMKSLRELKELAALEESGE